MISDRPYDRTEAVAREGDLIMRRHNRSAIGALVKWVSRYIIVLPVDDSRGSESLRDSLIAAFADVPAQLRISITWDQGSEMSLHEQITATTVNPDLFLGPAFTVATLHQMRTQIDCSAIISPNAADL